MLTAAMVNKVTEGMSEKDIAGVLEGRLEMIRMTVESVEELDVAGGFVWEVFAEAKVARLSNEDKAEFQRCLTTTSMSDFKDSALGLFYDMLEGLTWQEAVLFSELKKR